jgi:hypothetical protein
VLNPSILKRERPPRHLRSIKLVTGLKAYGLRPWRSLPRERVRSLTLVGPWQSPALRSVLPHSFCELQ